jgi:N-acetylmuramoyl-L-alanine amidase CwlA
MNITQEFLTPNKYSRPGFRLKKVKKIAIHYAGDAGATAQNMRDYFNSLATRKDRYASSHFAVGLLGEIIQMIPLNEWSYCTNAANSYSISIETCHPDSSGKFTEASEKSLIELVAALCKQFSLNPLTDVIRHYDVTKKCCPKYYVDHPEMFTAFKTAVKNCMAGQPYALPSYGKVIGTFTATPDTTGKFTVKQGRTYQFKITAQEQPQFACGNGAFKKIADSVTGNQYFYKVQAVGKVGDGAGFYMCGSKTPFAIATIIQ